MRKCLLPGSHCKYCQGPEGNVSVAKTEVSTVTNHTPRARVQNIQDDKFTKNLRRLGTSEQNYETLLKVNEDSFNLILAIFDIVII